MGGTNSHELCQTTPPRDEKSRKLLPFDPRSPSTDITRTPILVEKTPEGALDPMLDPRSPTAGIYRTPLTNMTDVKQGPSPQDTTVVPKLDLDLQSEPKVDSQVNSEVTTDNSDTSPLTAIGLQDLSIDEIPTSESTRLVDSVPEKPIAETEKRPKKSTKAPQPKELFPNKKGLSVVDNNTRSPLSTRNVDMNSPLQIIQRKQTNKVDKARISSTESPNTRFIVRDKENL